jgi:hypothetical protein
MVGKVVFMQRSGTDGNSVAGYCHDYIVSRLVGRRTPLIHTVLTEYDMDIALAAGAVGGVDYFGVEFEIVPWGGQNDRS